MRSASERLAELCRDWALRDKGKESDPLQDKGLVNVLEKKGQGSVRHQCGEQSQDTRFEALKNEFESSPLESVELETACRQQGQIGSHEHRPLTHSQRNF